MMHEDLSSFADKARIVEDMMLRILASMSRAERKAALIEARQLGTMTIEEVAFWFYVFGLKDA